MSQPSVEIVRRSLEAVARGDFEAAFSSYSPNAEWRMAADEPDPRTYRGLAGLRDFVDSAAEPWLDRFEDLMEFEGFIDRGDWVVVPWTARVRGRGKRDRGRAHRDLRGPGAGSRDRARGGVQEQGAGARGPETAPLDGVPPR